MSLHLVPMHLDAANAFIDAHHRHSDPVLQVRYAAGAAVEGEIVATVVAGRPKAWPLQDGWTQEVLRVCTPGADVDPRCFNACSMLYGAAWRAIRAMGYLRAVTYTVSYESGSSARAAGFVPVAVKKGGRSWDTPSRRREDRQQVDGVRWEIRAAAWRPGLSTPPRIELAKGDPNQLELVA